MDRKILQTLTLEVLNWNIEFKNIFESKNGQENPAGFNFGSFELKCWT